MVEIHFQIKIKQLQSDCRIEFKSLQSLLFKKEFLRRISYPYTIKHNCASHSLYSWLSERSYETFRVGRGYGKRIRSFAN